MAAIMKRVKKYIKNVNSVCKETGWNTVKAMKKMQRAKKDGMSYTEYVKEKGWNFSEQALQNQEWKKSSDKIISRDKVTAVIQATGWDEKKVVNSMKMAKKNGVSYGEYVSKHCYELNGSEIQEFGQILRQRKEQRKQNNEFYINAVCEKTGWDRDKAIKEMDIAKKNGVSYLKYVQKEFWLGTAVRNKRVGTAVVADKKRIADNKEKYVKAVCDATGWSAGKAELEINKAKVNCGSSYEDYVVFKLYELSPEEQRQYVTLDLFEKMRIKYNSHFKAFEYFDDKGKFNTVFSDLITRKWFLNENLTYEQFLENIKGLDAILVKRLTATQGKGIAKYNCNESEEKNRELYDTIMGLGKSIIEQYIIQHETMMKLCPNSVNTIRVTTLNYNNECKFLYSVVRMGRGAVVDNFHSGGIAASVDMKTGVVYTSAADLEGNTFPVHPVSKIPIKGMQIPHWEMILETCRKATGRVKDVNLVGWDFAVTPEGVELIEGNSGASYVVAQIPNIEDRIGLRSVMVDPYL